MTKNVKKAHPKKDLRDKLSVQLHMILAGFKDMVDEKKLHKLVKKAGKVLADGLHHKEPKPETAKKAPAKKTAPKKAAAAPKPEPAPKKAMKKAVKKTVKKPAKARK